MVDKHRLSCSAIGNHLFLGKGKIYNTILIYLQDGGLPPSVHSIISLPPPQSLPENGPLVFTRGPTITDV